ncbi:MAG TPA: hypothetical protein VF701_13875 [Thermoanaerobaculia bacterium]
MSGCQHEREILTAASEEWSEQQIAHVAECVECAAAAQAGPWMKGFARINLREHVLPDPTLVWLKANLLRGNVQATRATRPLDVVQMLSYLIVAAGWAAVLTLRWDSIREWMVSLTPAAIVQQAGSAPSLSLSFITIVFVLASMTVMLAMHTILVED